MCWFSMCNCILNSGVGMGDLALMQRFLHMYGQVHMQSHLSLSMNCYAIYNIFTSFLTLLVSWLQCHAYNHLFLFVEHFYCILLSISLGPLAVGVEGSLQHFEACSNSLL